tara:strand:- start:830 stop:1462 length:633 start_codon:yes stop_codon:yes gene_type:complete
MNSETVTGKNIYQRINAVMTEVEYIQKDKAVTGGGQNYKAVTHDQVNAACRKSIVSNGIVIVPRQISGEFLVMRDINATPQPVKMGLYSGSYEIDFVNMDKPEEKVTVSVQAHASDNGDKAPGKAMTYAVKTAVVKQFYFETGENDESRTEQDDVDFISVEQQGQLYRLLVDQETTQLTPKGQQIAKAFKFNLISEIKSKKFEAILKAAS